MLIKKIIKVLIAITEKKGLFVVMIRKQNAKMRPKGITFDCITTKTPFLLTIGNIKCRNISRKNYPKTFFSVVQINFGKFHIENLPAFKYAVISKKGRGTDSEKNLFV